MSRNSRGDTIIEVMFAMAIIGVVLAAAYATASKNLQTSQLAKERTQATNIAEAQVEQLKSLGTDITDTSFCIDIEQADAVINTTAETPEAGCVEGFYSKTITKTANKYKVLVEWIPPGGSDTNKANVTIFYSDYDFALSGSSNISVFIESPSSGSTVVMGAFIRSETGITRTGFVYSTSQNPELNTVGSTPVDATLAPGSNSYSATITGLDPAVIYYFRAFAITSNGYIQSVPIPVNNVPIVAPVETAPIIRNFSASFTSSTASFTGLVDPSGSPITRRVITYYRTSTPSAVRQLNISSDSFNNVTVGSLLPNTSYTYVLTVENAIGETSSTPATFTTDPVTVPNSTPLGEFNGSMYYLINDSVTWAEAKLRAEAMGGHLVTIGSATENSYVSSRVSGVAWIGATDSRVEGVWEWVTGEPANYLNFATGQPDNAWGGQHFAVINWSGDRWDDQSASDLNRYVVEFESVPYGTELNLPVGVTEIPNSPNNNRYYLSSGQVTCDEAYAAAAGSGGHLVTIGSATENSFVANAVAAGQRIWLGLNDKAVENTWRWVTSEPVSFTNWAPGEPNNYLNGVPGEDCAAMNWSGLGTWNDWYNDGYGDSRAYYVIEYEGR